MCCHLLFFADKDRCHFYMLLSLNGFAPPMTVLTATTSVRWKVCLCSYQTQFCYILFGHSALLTTRSYTKSESIVMPCDHPSWYFDPEIGKTTQNQLRKSLRFFKSIHSFIFIHWTLTLYSACFGWSAIMCSGQQTSPNFLGYEYNLKNPFLRTFP